MHINKRYSVDERGKPKEVVILLEGYRKIEELLGLDLDAEAVKQLNPHALRIKQFRRHNAPRSASYPLILFAAASKVGGTTVFHPVRAPNAEQLQTLLNQIIRRLVWRILNIGAKEQQRKVVTH